MISHSPVARNGSRIPRWLSISAFISGALIFQAWVVFRVLPAQAFQKYPLAAEHWLAGRLSAERLLDYSPLYLCINVLAQKLMSHSIQGLLVLNVLLLALSAGLLYALLARYCPSWLCGAGTIAFITLRCLLAYAHVIAPEIVLVCGVTAMLYCASSASVRMRFLGGLFLALCAGIRPNYLPLVGLVPLHFLLIDGTGRKWVKSSLVFGVPPLVLFAGLCVRNFHATGYFSPIVMNPGEAFYEGNNPCSLGFDCIYPPIVDDVARAAPGEADYQHEVYRDIARRVVGGNLTVPAVNAFWMRKARNFLFDHPGHAFRLYARKLFHCFHEYQWHDVSTAYWDEVRLKASWIPAFPFSLLSALCIVGLLSSLTDWRRRVLFYEVLAVQLLVMIVVYTTERQRLAIVPLFVVFACFAVNDARRHTSRRVVLLGAALVCSLTFVLHRRTDIMSEDAHLWRGQRLAADLQEQALRAQSEGRLADSERASSRAAAAAPWLLNNQRLANVPYEAELAAIALPLIPLEIFSDRLDAAILRVELGRTREARSLIEGLIDERRVFRRDFIESSEPYFWLAQTDALDGDRRSAVEHLQTALRRSPGDPWVLASLVALTGSRTCRDQLYRYYDDIDAQLFLGMAYFAAGKAADAADSLQVVVRQMPEYRSGHLYLAAALGRLGKYEEAAAEYRSAVRMAPQPLMLERDITGIFRALAQARPTDSHAAYSYGVVLRQYGHFHEALDQQRGALALDASNGVIQHEIRLLQDLIAQASAG